MEGKLILSFLRNSTEKICGMYRECVLLSLEEFILKNNRPKLFFIEPHNHNDNDDNDDNVRVVNY